MYNLLKGEFLKLKSNIAFRYILLITCIISVMTTINKIYDIERDIKVDGVYVSLEKDVMGRIIEILTPGNIMIIMVAIIGGIFICYDFEHKLVQSEVSAGCSKFNILFSKAVVYFMITSIFLLAYSLIGVVSLAIIYELWKEFTLIVILQMLRIYLLSVLINCGIASFIIMISYIFKNSSISIGLSILSILTYEVTVAGLENLFPFIEEIADKYSIFALGNVLQLEMSCSSIAAIVLNCLIHIAGFLIITYYIFKRTELR